MIERTYIQLNAGDAYEAVIRMRAGGGQGGR